MKEIKCWYFLSRLKQFQSSLLPNQTNTIQHQRQQHQQFAFTYTQRIPCSWLLTILYRRVKNTTILYYVQRNHYSFKMSTEHESKEFISRLLFILNVQRKITQPNEEKKLFFPYFCHFLFVEGGWGCLHLCLVDCVRCGTIAVASHSFFPFIHSFVHCGIAKMVYFDSPIV